MTSATDGEIDDEMDDTILDALSDRWDATPERVQHLHGELDQTYRVDAIGRSVVVKVRPATSEASVDLELAVLAQLADAGLPVPAIVPSISGHVRERVGESDLWVLEWVEGALWASVPHRGDDLLRELGGLAARSADALSHLEHADAHRTHHWDVRHADRSIRAHLDRAGEHAAAVEGALATFTERVLPRLDSLPVGIVHQDINDHNLLVGGRVGEHRIAGLLDPGDALHSVVVSELAVAVAYAMLRTTDPLAAARQVVAGWVEVASLGPDEIDCIFPMAFARLCVNATTWAERGANGQAEYADARSSHTWATITQLDGIDPDLASLTLRAAAGFGPPTAIAQAARSAAAPSRTAAFATAETVVPLGVDPNRDEFDLVDPIDLDAVAAAVADDRSCYRPHLAIRLDRGARADGSGGPATLQLGVELATGDRFDVVLPRAGRVVATGTERVVVEHGAGTEHFWSIWDAVSHELEPGQTVAGGDPLGEADRLRVRLSVVDPTGPRTLPYFVNPSQRDAWVQLSPDPAPFLGLGLGATVATPHLSAHEVTALREHRLARSQRSYYREPMNLVRARGTWFVDDAAHHYLDAINNVTHVGHGHPRVVAAATRQMRRLNTNSRFVYEEMARYADRLAGTLPDPLDVVFLVCTGSEANDLALRIARQVTGRGDVMVIDGAYHGNTTAVTGISPNRYQGAGGTGPPSTTHEVVQPNMYRGPFAGVSDAGARYAESVSEVVGRLAAEGRPPAAFIAESLMGTAGQIVYPSGYLAKSFAHVRATGGLCISDEVQVGFGRLGRRFWGFELGGVVPDIVTMGKPMGNGHPIAAVVTSREIADAFDTGMKYFNTFGGNPVSCAVAGAVLDVIDDEGLQARALDVGGVFAGRLRELMARHDCIGDVRAEGLYLGVEFVHDRATREPAAGLTVEISERMRERGVVVYPNGDLGNVLKIKPPMVFSEHHVDVFVEQLDATLGELAWSR